MLTYPEINPVIAELGPFAIRWYGLMYVVGFLGVFGYSYGRHLPTWSSDTIIDLLFYGAIGVILGGTWGYLLLYEPHYFVTDPLRALRFWEPGRSFHGGLIGVLVAFFVFAKVHRRTFLSVSDFIAPAIPIGLMAGRFGNFLNGELWGRVTTVSWGMVFPHAGSLPRHPSQLYELGLEGIVLFLILHFYAKKNRPSGAVSGLFLLCYGLFRFMIEFLREPDMHQGFVAFNWLTKGQLFSIPMIVFGIWLMWSSYHAHKAK